MNAEPIMNRDTLPTEPTHRWADDEGVLTDERQPERQTRRRRQRRRRTLSSASGS